MNDDRFVTAETLEDVVAQVNDGFKAQHDALVRVAAGINGVVGSINEALAVLAKAIPTRPLGPPPQELVLRLDVAPSARLKTVHHDEHGQITRIEDVPMGQHALPAGG